MRKLLRGLPGAVIVIAGLGLLYLTNTGLVSFRRPYIYQIAVDDAPGAVAFVDVNVVPMDVERILKNQTVVVRDGVIERVGPSGAVNLPPGARVVPGAGRYLMPGLADMHAHVQDENDLLLWAANGVTTIRNMWGNTNLNLNLGLPDQLALRAAIARGDLLGPTLYTAGPIMEGEPAASPMLPVFLKPAEAETSVAWQAAQGYDFVKVYDHLSPEVYWAIARAAEAQGLPVAGHVPKAVGLEAVLASGQVTIEHLIGYVDPDTAEFIIPEAQLEAYAALTREAGVWNCPTLGLYIKSGLRPEEAAELERQPGMRYVSPRMQAIWRFFYAQMMTGHTYAGDDYAERIGAVNRRAVQALHGAGAKLLLGTDASNPFLIPGFSVHAELALLVAAGLSPYEALETGTRHAAEALGRAGEFGVVAEGQRADLLLLEANPLDDVANVNRRAGVMLRGRWLTEAQMQAWLEALAASHAPTLAERLWPLGVIILGVLIGLPRARPA